MGRERTGSARDAANGPRMVRQENIVQVVLPGGEQYEESKWINNKVLDRTKNLRRQKADGNYYWTARDNMGREFVSNVNWVLGGLQAGDIMGVLLRDIWERFGPFNAVSITLEEWEEILDNGMPWRRLELGHPSFIQFREESSGLRAKAEFEEQRQRDDEGGRRTLKFEFATTEFQLGGGERFQLEVGPRMSTTQGLDWFISPCMARRMVQREGREEVEMEFDILNTPANDWPMNIGRQPRRFCRGKKGVKQWQS